MKLTTLMTIAVAFLALACNNTNDQSNVDQPTTEVKVVEKRSLTAGLEAKTKREAALWSEKELKVLEGENWENAEASIKLKSGAVVYVIEVGDEYAKVMTLIGQDGYVIKKILYPISKASLDSTKYFEKKKIAHINTFVDGMDVGTVNLWRDMTSRNNMVDQLIKGDKVAIIEEQGEYVKLATINGKVGWCMNGFIKK